MTESVRRGQVAWRRTDDWRAERLHALALAGPSAGRAVWLRALAVGGLSATRKVGLIAATASALLLEGAAALVGSAMTAADATLGWGLSAVAWPLESAFSVPYVGRGLGLLWRGLLTLVWAVIGLPDALLALGGILPEKRLRLWLLLPPAETAADQRARQRAREAVSVAARILRRQANIRLIPVLPFQFDYAFSRPKPAEGGWLRGSASGRDLAELEVGCGREALADDLGGLGGRLDRWSRRLHPRGAYRRLTGWGAPLMAVGVRKVGGGRLVGCSLGPLVDYLTFATANPVCLAHEIGHACNLPHWSAPMNLMNPTCGGVHLTRWQVALLRLSRHVTYL